MSISVRKKVAIGATGFVVLAGSGGAFAAAQGTPKTTKTDPAAEQKAFLDDLAKRLNVTTDALSSAIKGARGDQIDAAVTAGTLTKEQGDAAKKRLESSTGVPLLGGPGTGFGGGPGRGGPGPRGGGPGGRMGGGPFEGLDGAATYLGLTPDQMRTQLQAGKSLSDIAKAQGKDLDGLKAAIKTSVSSQLDQAVKDGKLTADQRTKILADLDKRIDDLVTRAPKAGGPPMPGGGGRGHGFFRHP